MARIILWAGLALCVASAPPAHARTLWQDTVQTDRNDGEANDVAVTSAMVIAGGGTVIRDHSEALLRAYAPLSGTLLWQDRRSVGGGSEEILELATLGRRIFAAVSAFRFSQETGSDWVVRAHDEMTGALLWEDDRDDGDLDAAQNVTAADGRVFVAGTVTAGDAGAAAVVRAYDAVTGALLWQDVGAPGVASLGVSEVVAGAGRVWVASDYVQTTLLRAYDAATGMLVWTDTLDKAFVGHLAAAGGRLFISTHFGPRGFVRAYDGESGVLAWQVEEAADTPKNRNVLYDTALAASDDVLYTGVTRLRPVTSALTAYDAGTGAVLWRNGDAGAAWDLTLDGTRLYAATGTEDFGVRAFASASGALAWQSARREDGRAFAIATRAGVVFAAGFAGPAAGAFHVAAFDGARGLLVKPVIRGRTLPTVPVLFGRVGAGAGRGRGGAAGRP